MQQTFCDLHIHTTYSDGEYTPSEIVRKAAEVGLSVIAVTDHDNILGIDEAIMEGNKAGITVVPGVELSAEDNSSDIHILGYLFNHHDIEFRERLHFFRNERIKRAKTIVEKLKKLGVHISFEEVLAEAGGAAVGRPHIAQVLVKYGYVNDIKEAFENYLGYESPAYVPKFKMTVKEAIDMIKKAGGIPVLAHPGLSVQPDKVVDYVKFGLLGIEVWHPEHDEKTIALYIEIAEKYGLVKTGGSDYHGENRRGGKKAGLGSVKLPLSVVMELYRLKERLKVA